MLPAGMKRAKKSDHTKRYGRLRRRGLCCTILTKCDPHWGSYIHPTQDRTLTVREAADVYCGRGQSILKRRDTIRRKTIELRRLHHLVTASTSTPMGQTLS